MDRALINYVAYASLLNFATSIFLGVLILLKSSKSYTARAFSYYCFSVGIWAFFYYRWMCADSYEEGLVGNRSLNFLSIFIPSFFSNFTFKFLEKNNSKIMLINIVLCIVLGVFAFSPLYIESVSKKTFYPYYPVPGPLFHLMFIYFALNVIYAHYLLWKEMIVSRGIRLRQIKYLFWGTFIAFTSGSMNFFLVYNIPIPPVLDVLISVYVIAVSYAIIRYRLMGIRLTGADKERLQSMLAVTSSVNHEIRNPLNFIIADSQELLKELDQLSEPDLRNRTKSVLASISSNAGRVVEITRAMTRYAKPIKDKTEFDAIDIAQSVKSVVANFKKHIPSSKSLRIPIRFDGKIGKVYGDQVFIEESLRNLLDNAEFAIHTQKPEQGIINVRIYDYDSKRIMMSVKDNGCGIERRDLTKIFDLGYSRRSHDGFKHGAGLFLIKWYADQMKSEIQIASTPGEGTTVYMSFLKAKKK